MGVKLPIACRLVRHAACVTTFCVATAGFTLRAEAQGGGAILPLSAVSVVPSADIPFTVYNFGENDLDFRIDPICDLDGTERTGEDCYKVFSLAFDVEMKNGIIRVPKGGRANATVKLIEPGSLRFALFKPLVDPLFPQELGRNAVAFKLNYQPGYLYILKPAEEKLQNFTFLTSASTEQRRANFEFDISALTMPQEVNMSVKISDKASGKLIRFVPLVKNKIVDPRRKKLQVSSDFAPATSKGAVCVQLFVQSSSFKSSYRLDACEN